MSELGNSSRYSGEKFGILAATLATAFATLVILVLTLSPESDDTIAAIVFPPGTPHSESLQTTVRLGGSPISFTGAGSVVIAGFEEIPDFVKVWNSGAIVALNPLAETGCSSKNKPSGNQLIKSRLNNNQRPVLTERKT
jgi:hypothetical protein